MVVWRVVITGFVVLMVMEGLMVPVDMEEFVVVMEGCGSGGDMGWGFGGDVGVVVLGGCFSGGDTEGLMVLVVIWRVRW
ncbi:hypothetical protein BW13_05375 [Bifidobacterium sp. UTCIF-37]|nr:hypothetical protein BW13_05375 [Bifidobacterium sp. UTCIF-37]TPF89480.1 hypothetical protein BW11_05385 [Bifidobacterium sp. UTCIF-38]